MREPGASAKRPSQSRALDVIPCCPRGFEQRERACLGYYERETLRLQIRVLIRDNEGICAALVEENDESVAIRLIVCESDDPSDWLLYDGYADERHHVTIARPLGNRTVVDYVTGRPMSFYVPTWCNGRPTEAPGYYTDREEARAGWELVKDVNDRESRPRRNAPEQIRTLGF